MQVYIEYDDDVTLHVECGWSGKYFAGSREEPPEEPEFDIHDVSYSLDNLKDLDEEELTWYKKCLEKYIDSDRFFKDAEEAARNLDFDDYYD